MSEASEIGRRKERHLRICVEASRYRVETREGGAGFGGLSFAHLSAPELSDDELDCSTDFLGRRIPLPLFVSCMTGGSEGGFRVNRELALAAGEAGIPIGTGSARILLERPELAPHFRLKAFAPEVPLLVNIGGVQCARSGPAAIVSLADLVEADAIVVHLNPGQELFEADGDRDFRGVLDGVARLAEKSRRPVVVKETGFGIGPTEAARLLGLGAAAVDLAGAGGTNWVAVEGYRAEGPAALAAGGFSDWGYRTAPLLLALAGAVPPGRLFASGGVRDGVEGAKALALGAGAVGMALPLARAAESGGAEAVLEEIEAFRHSLRAVMLLSGSRRVEDLRRGVLVADQAVSAEADRITRADAAAFAPPRPAGARGAVEGARP